MHTRRAQHGITLIEIGVVVAIVAVTLTTALPSFAGFVAQRRLDGVAAQLATDLQFVRAQAVARNEPVRISFHRNALGSCYVVHTGAPAQCPCTGPGPAACSGGARALKTVWLPGERGIVVTARAASTLSDPLHGTSSPTNEVRVTGPRGRAVHHIVNLMGRVRSCSPGAAMPGYPAC